MRALLVIDPRFIAATFLFMTENCTPALYCWNDKVLYIGQEQGRGLRSHSDAPVAALVAGMTGDISLSSDLKPEMELKCRSAFWQPGSSWNDQFTDHFSSSLMIDPLNPLRQAIVSRTTAHDLDCGYKLDNEEQWIELLQEIYRDRPEQDEVEARIHELFYPNSAEPQESSLDKRIVEIAGLLEQNYMIKKTTAELAEHVNLSEVHLVQLFKRQVGVPIGRYIFWRRFLHTMRAVLQGKNVTESAMEAGFADTAHFSRAFKTAIGVSPSKYWKRLYQKT